MTTQLAILPEVKDAVKFTLAVCEFNPSPYIQEAKTYVSKYQGVEIGPEDCKAITIVIKDLKKRAKDFDTARKDIKREYNQPLTILEENIKSIISVYDLTIDDLNKKMEVYEVKYRDERTTLVKDLTAQAIEAAKLNKKYADQVVILEEYYNKTATPRKIAKSLADRCAVEFTNQENERLAAEVRAEREQRRFETLKQLNANYASRIASEVTHVKTAHLNDEELYAFFRHLEDDFAKQQLAMAETITPVTEAIDLEFKKVADKLNESVAFSSENLFNEPLSAVIELEPIKVEQPLPTNTTPIQAAPVVTSTRYIVDLICGKQDTITPWLDEMQKHGIKVQIVRKL